MEVTRIKYDENVQVNGCMIQKDTDLLPASHTNIENVNNRGKGERKKKKQKAR